MTDTPSFRPRDLDPATPTSARLYHAMLTGETFYDSDAEFVERLHATVPIFPVWARHNRDFLRRAVRYMAATAGIRQFLDIGSGLPTGGNTHQIAREIDPAARVVYVDIDTDAIARAQELLIDEGALDTTTMLGGDLRNPADILTDPATTRLIDFTEPVGVLLISILPFIGDDHRPGELLAQLRRALAPGSHLALTHVSLSHASAETRRQVADGAAAYAETLDPVTLRTPDQITGFLDGFTLVDPGITYAPDWRPEHPIDVDDPARPCNFAAVGYLP